MADDEIAQGLGEVRRSAFVSGTTRKSYVKASPIESQRVFGYLDGGPWPNPSTLMGTGLSRLERARRTSEPDSYVLLLGENQSMNVLTRFYGPAQLPATATTLYTVPTLTSVVIRRIHVSNPSASAVDFTLSLGTDASGSRMWDDFSIPAESTYAYTPKLSLSAGEIVQAFAGSAGTLVVTMDGWEQPSPGYGMTSYGEVGWGW